MHKIKPPTPAFLSIRQFFCYSPSLTGTPETIEAAEDIVSNLVQTLQNEGSDVLQYAVEVLRGVAWLS